MKNNPITPADEKALAMNFAMTALIKTLARDHHLDMDSLFNDLAGATRQLKTIGENGAAFYLGAFAEDLQKIE